MRLPVYAPPSAGVRRRMQAVRTRDTAPELALRSELHRLGLRFRLGVVLLAGTRRRVDIVFPGAKVVCLVHGCFWHGCPKHLVWPTRNPRFWRAKIRQNQARDVETEQLLRESGWAVVVCWEHEAPERVAARVYRIVRRRLSASRT